MLCPSENAEKVNKELMDVAREGIKQDLEDNGMEGVVMRELANHEYGYTGEIDATVDALEGYNIPLEDIKRIAKKYRQTYKG